MAGGFNAFKLKVTEIKRKGGDNPRIRLSVHVTKRPRLTHFPSANTGSHTIHKLTHNPIIVWVTRPERPKGTKDKVKHTSYIFFLYFDIFTSNISIFLNLDILMFLRLDPTWRTTDEDVQS